MDLGAGHWLIFLPFTQISVGNCIWIEQTQVSFQSNFKNKFKFWCWAKPMNGAPSLLLKLLIEERTPAIGLALLFHRTEDRRKKNLICGLFYSKSIVLCLPPSWSVPWPSLMAKVTHNQWEVSENPGVLTRKKVTHLSIYLSSPYHFSIINLIYYVVFHTFPPQIHTFILKVDSDYPHCFVTLFYSPNIISIVPCH